MRKKIICFSIAMLLMIPLLSFTAAADNNPPDPPTIDGPTSGKTGTTYTYQFCGYDPDLDDIIICVQWGDNTGEVCYGPFPSGTCIDLDHTWTSQGTYTISAYCTDSHEAKSDTATLRVTMPRARLVQFGFILEWLQNFPLISYILGL